MATKSKPAKALPRNGDGASLRLYAGSNQDIISLNADWTPQNQPTLSGDLWADIRGAFITQLNDLTNKDKHRG